MNHQRLMMNTDIKMSIRKLPESDFNKKAVKPCFHPDHQIPMFQVFENGTYEHKCDGCGQTSTFTVNRPTF